MSEYTQKSFSGGMDLKAQDVSLNSSQFRMLLNARNRYGDLEPVKKSTRDTNAPSGIKQELITFGEFEVLFVAGKAYYKHHYSTGWKLVDGFSMSRTAPRYWTVNVPLATTRYVRRSSDGTAYSTMSLNSISGAFGGNDPGLLVQDNINQPQFIYIDEVTGVPVCRTTQKFTEWNITYTDKYNVTVAKDASNNYIDNREYVPIGNCMAFVDGVLWVVSQDRNALYRSVTGRPLDFVVNVTNQLATNITAQTYDYYDVVTGTTTTVAVPPYTQIAGGAYKDGDRFYEGGDAVTTSYSVGVGDISCIRQDGAEGLFVSAANSNFIVTKNKANNAPLVFGEYTFVRTFLFNATNTSDRAVIDTLGDTRLIAIRSIVSFNATAQLKNEGRNSVFSSTVQVLLKGILQTGTASAAILYDDYELYAVNTVLGAAILVYDTINNVWVGVDTTQTDGKLIKAFAKIEQDVQKLYAITEDDQLYSLYSGTEYATATLRTGAVNLAGVSGADTIKANDPKRFVKLSSVRLVLNNVTADVNINVTPLVDNRISTEGTQTKSVQYVAPKTSYNGNIDLEDNDSMLVPAYFSFVNCNQGWKTALEISWSNGRLAQLSMDLTDVTPSMNSFIVRQ